MKSLAPRLAILLFPIILVLAAPQSRADMWCSDGPGTKLSHPCTDDDDNPAVSAAIEKYQDQWMDLDGVYQVDDSDIYHNRIPSILVHVDSPSVDRVRKQIPSSVDGIPVVVVPGKMPEAGGAVGFFSYNATQPDPEEVARRVRKQEDKAKTQELYTSIVQQYGERWDDLPGVLGVGADCDDDGCKAIEVTVQRELLSRARDEIPSSVNGVRIVLTPDDD